MAHRVCPWWLGYVLASPLRRLFYDPSKILAPYVREGMTVLEPGPGMGFFTLELTRRVGVGGRVIAVEIQPRMIAALKRRLAKAGLLERVEVRLAQPDSMGIADIAGTVDLTLAFAVVHEMPSAERFFAEVAAASKPGASLLFAEPKGHVPEARLRDELRAAMQAGFTQVERPVVPRSHAVLLKKE